TARDTLRACEWGGEPLYGRGQTNGCLKERAASPETSHHPATGRAAITYKERRKPRAFEGPGIGNRESGIGNRESGIGNREKLPAFAPFAKGTWGFALDPPQKLAAEAALATAGRGKGRNSRRSGGSRDRSPGKSIAASAAPTD